MSKLLAMNKTDKSKWIIISNRHGNNKSDITISINILLSHIPHVMIPPADNEIKKDTAIPLSLSQKLKPFLFQSVCLSELVK
jgi:hypothetical protein